MLVLTNIYTIMTVIHAGRTRSLGVFSLAVSLTGSVLVSFPRVPPLATYYSMLGDNVITFFLSFFLSPSIVAVQSDLNYFIQIIVLEVVTKY